MALAVWTWSEALLRASRDGISGRVQRGVWQLPFRSVYVPTADDLTPEEWALAAVLATGGRPQPAGPVAVASGRTAARVWGLALIDDDDPVTGGKDRYLHEVTTARSLSDLVPHAPADGSPVHQLARVRRQMTKGEIVWHEDGFWITTPLRTAIDCVPDLTVESSVCLLDQGLRSRLLSVEDLVAAVTARKGRVGSPALAAAVALMDGRSESAAETLARLLLLPVLPGLVPQVRARNAQNRVVARFDLADEEIRLAVEVDGKAGHAGEQMVAKDRARDRLTERLGWWTERCTWIDLRRDRDELVARVLWRAEQLRSRAA